jgi:hypothetical protein
MFPETTFCVFFIVQLGVGYYYLFQVILYNLFYNEFNYHPLTILVSACLSERQLLCINVTNALHYIHLLLLFTWPKPSEYGAAVENRLRVYEKKVLS